ncbi:serine/threonine-protein kinase [Corallococcus macrosporus]|uniref:non-specific serine/threonine protein kinase n=1 Tax=Corallococcus macrosporus DSM 14697 TaxID=1189310 RepID=A0A250K244_9BACT|nr:serine/threonine-protein kinase [Corallococcus macrosporus]ATB50169.1 serine/threonine protein kinase [Corallococcus macrosporus DSM 14697]
MMESNAPTNGAPPDVADPMLGRVLNERFRILETLGAGGMGRVYKAVQSPLDRLVALKVLNPQYGEGKDPGFQKRFFLEASVTAKLRHPNTVTVIDYGKTDDGIYYIAMEYLEGLTLGQLLTQVGPLPWPRALNITQQIARSLREAHKVGLIHRDLKPANVMVLNQETDHDVVKVLDFGLVKSFIGDAAPIPQDTSITQAGIILGSPQYMAPEQARNVADPRSDVYSLGVVLYQMLMGRPPFLAAQSIDVIVKHINELPPAFGALYPGHGIPGEVEALVMKCLAKSPPDRYQSMDEVMEAMRRTLSTVGVSGAFSGARFAGISGVGGVGGSGPISGPHGSGPHGAAGSGPATMALDISVEEAPEKGGRKPLGLILGGGALLAGLGAALVVALRPAAPTGSPPTLTPPPASRAAPEAAPREAAVAARPPDESVAEASDEELALAPLRRRTVEPVRFLVVSEPMGARVTYQGKDLGETPLNLEVAPAEGGVAEAVLFFTLDGYQRARGVAKGAGPEERFTQKLLPKKKASTRPAKAPDSSPYKDDPY